MTPLEKAIAAAYQSQGKQEDVVKVHTLMLRTRFLLPIQKNSPEDNPQALFYSEKGQNFVPVFDDIETYTRWAGDSIDSMTFIEIAGYDLVKGLSDDAFLCVNIGGACYKEFAPDEVARLKSIVKKFS